MTELEGISMTGVTRELALGFLGVAGFCSSSSGSVLVTVISFLGLPRRFFAGGSASSSTTSGSAVAVFLGRPLRLAGTSATEAVSDPFSEMTVIPLLDALTRPADKIFCVCVRSFYFPT